MKVKHVTQSRHSNMEVVFFHTKHEAEEVGYLPEVKTLNRTSTNCADSGPLGYIVA